MKRFTGHKEDWGTFIDIKQCDKAVISAIKMMIAALKGLIYLLIAGGWIVVVIIIVICMIGFLVSSIFGIFLSNDYDANSKRMVRELLIMILIKLYSQKVKLDNRKKPSIYS